MKKILMLILSLILITTCSCNNSDEKQKEASTTDIVTILPTEVISTQAQDVEETLKPTEQISSEAPREEPTKVPDEKQEEVKGLEVIPPKGMNSIIQFNLDDSNLKEINGKIQAMNTKGNNILLATDDSIFELDLVTKKTKKIVDTAFKPSEIYYYTNEGKEYIVMLAGIRMSVYSVSNNSFMIEEVKLESGEKAIYITDTEMMTYTIPIGHGVTYKKIYKPNARKKWRAEKTELTLMALGENGEDITSSTAIYNGTGTLFDVFCETENTLAKIEDIDSRIIQLTKYSRADEVDRIYQTTGMLSEQKTPAYSDSYTRVKFVIEGESESTVDDKVVSIIFPNGLYTSDVDQVFTVKDLFAVKINNALYFSEQIIPGKTEFKLMNEIALVNQFMQDYNFKDIRIVSENDDYIFFLLENFEMIYFAA